MSVTSLAETCTNVTHVPPKAKEPASRAHTMTTARHRTGTPCVGPTPVHTCKPRTHNDDGSAQDGHREVFVHKFRDPTTRTYIRYKRQT